MKKKKMENKGGWKKQEKEDKVTSVDWAGEHGMNIAKSLN